MEVRIISFQKEESYFVKTLRFSTECGSCLITDFSGQRIDVFCGDIMLDKTPIKAAKGGLLKLDRKNKNVVCSVFL